MKECKVCKKSFKSILKHLQQNESCKNHYNLEEVKKEAKDQSYLKKKQYQDKYRQQDHAKEADKQRKKIKHSRDPEAKKKKNESSKQYREKNKDTLNSIYRMQYGLSTEKAIRKQTYQSAWYEKHREERKVYMKEYHKKKQEETGKQEQSSQNNLSHKNPSNVGLVNNVQCKGCGGSYTFIMKHLSKSKSCQLNYDMEKLKLECADTARKNKRDFAYHKYHTNDRHKQSKIDYQKDYDKNNYESIRSQQRNSMWAVYQAVPEEKKKKIAKSRLKRQEAKAKKEAERAESSRKFLSEMQIDGCKHRMENHKKWILQHNPNISQEQLQEMMYIYNKDCNPHAKEILKDNPHLTLDSLQEFVNNIIESRNHK